MLYSFWIASCTIPEWRSRFDYQIQLGPGFADVEHHVSAYCKYLYRRQEHHNHVGYTLRLAAGEDLQWFSLAHPAAARNPSQCCNNYYRDHILFREHTVSWVDTRFKPLEGHSSEFSGVCLCVIDHIYLLIASGTFRDSAGYVLFAASIFCCIRTCIVSRAVKHLCVCAWISAIRQFRGL